MRLHELTLALVVSAVRCLLALGKNDVEPEQNFKVSDSVLHCGACIALIEEIDWQTEIISPKHKIQIGNFQLDAKGNMKVKEVPLGQSEVHIIEVMETVCRYMVMYTLYIDNNGRSNYIRTMSRDGQKISKRHTEDLATDKKGTLEFYCDVILEAHDDELIAMYQAKEKDITEKLCVTMAGLCSKQNVTDHLWSYASAVMLGMSETAAAAGDKKAQETLDRMDREENAAKSGSGMQDSDELSAVDDDDRVSIDETDGKDRVNIVPIRNDL